MSYLLKDLYSPAFYNQLSDVLKRVVPGFKGEDFLTAVFTPEFGSMELKQRMRHTAVALHRFMPTDFDKAASILADVILELRTEKFGEDSLVFMFLPDYIETYGINNYDAAVSSLELTTQFVSCEYAVRPFLLQYGKQMFEQMTAWSLHPNYKVRRLASEGTRSRLPWAMAVPMLKKDPAGVIVLLDNMKNDPHEWVRRSVANNLNDIAKDYPELVIDVAYKWKGISPETDTIIRHGCRTLLKQGHPEMLSYYGLHSQDIYLNDFEILSPEVPAGAELSFSFGIVNKGTTPQIVRLEYAMYYLRKNGSYAKKVFKISERMYLAGEVAQVVRRQSFRPITTRRYYAGQHKIAIVVNGMEKASGDFILL